MGLSARAGRAPVPASAVEAPSIPAPLRKVRRSSRLIVALRVNSDVVDRLRPAGHPPPPPRRDHRPRDAAILSGPARPCQEPPVGIPRAPAERTATTAHPKRVGAW